MQQVFKLFEKKSKKFYLIILLLGIINSVLGSGLILFINNTILRKPLPFLEGYNWLVFIFLLVFSFFFNRLFQVYMIGFSTDILSDFEQSLMKKIRFASFEAFQKIGPEKVYTAFADTRTLASIPESLIGFINSSVMAISGLIYMFWVSWIGALSVLVLMSSLLIFYLLKNKEIEKSLNILRDLQNEYHRYLADFLRGFKEIKMSINKNDNIYNDFIKRNIVTSRRLSKETAIKYQGNELLGHYGWYILIGLVLFGLPVFAGIKMEEVSGFILILLFLGGPISGLISIIPFYTKVKIASERLNSLEKEVDENIKTKESHGDLADINPVFKGLAFQNITYNYDDTTDNKGFSVGPINFMVEKGEIVFITGGNGSGKSSFINLLVGIYKAKSGKILLNGHEIMSEKHPYYRNQLSVIFTDFYLFSENYDDYKIAQGNAQLDEYINLMKLTNILQIEKEKNWINTDLSKGQQKRLALILGLMENRQIIVLDEWASEQDPTFRQYFYKVLIPYLKKTGKTVIAVTHDDAYFNCADRIIKFDSGQIVADNQQVPHLEKNF